MPRFSKSYAVAAGLSGLLSLAASGVAASAQRASAPSASPAPSASVVAGVRAFEPGAGSVVAGGAAF